MNQSDSPFFLYREDLNHSFHNNFHLVKSGMKVFYVIVWKFYFLSMIKRK